MYLTIHAIERAILIRNQVHSQGNPQSTGVYRSKQVFIFHFLERGTKLQVRLPAPVFHPVGIIETDQTEGATDANTCTNAFLEVKEIEIPEMVVTFSGVEECHTDNLVSGTGLTQF